MDLHLKPTAEKRIPTTPFSRDTLGRVSEVKLIASFIENAPAGFVLAIDGAWGAGKTTFLEMLADYLRNGASGTSEFAGGPNGALVIEHNAWATDFSEDPLMPLIKEFDRALKRDSRYASDASFKATAQKLGRSGLQIVAKKSANLVVKAVSRRIFDSETVNEFTEILAGLKTDGLLSKDDPELEEQDLNDIIESMGEAASEALGKQLQAMSAAHDLERLQVFAFQKRLEALTSAVKESQKDRGLKFSVVVIIDELDRCRPTYAIEMLERIKHLFSVKDIVFILGIARDQLQHSINAVYGQGFNAHGYLHRFIDLDYKLEVSLNADFINSAFKKIAGKDASMKSDLSDGFFKYARLLRLTSRDIQQVLVRYAVLHNFNWKTGVWKFWATPFYVLYLICLRQSNVQVLMQFKIDDADLKKTVAALWAILHERLGASEILNEAYWAEVVLAGYLSNQLTAKLSADQSSQVNQMRSQFDSLGSGWPQKTVSVLQEWHSIADKPFHATCIEFVEMAVNFEK